MADYAPFTWVDDDGSGTVGTLVTAARMNALEAGVEDAAERQHARVALSALPAAGPTNKNWLLPDENNCLWYSDGTNWFPISGGGALKKFCVEAVSLVNVNVASPGGVGVGGWAGTSGVSRFLLVSQTTASENGIWIWQGAGNPMTRAPDALADVDYWPLHTTVDVLYGWWSGTTWRLYNNALAAMTFLPMAGTLLSETKANMPSNSSSRYNDCFYWATDEDALYIGEGGAWIRADAAALAAWKPMGIKAAGLMQSAHTVALGPYVIYVAGSLGTPGNQGLGVFRLDPALHAVAGTTVKIKMEVDVLVSDVAPGVTFTVDLRPISGLDVATSVQSNTQVTEGAAALTTTHTTPGLRTITRQVSGEITMPAAGLFVYMVTPSGTPAVNSVTTILPSLYYRNV